MKVSNREQQQKQWTGTIHCVPRQMLRKSFQKVSFPWRLKDEVKGNFYSAIHEESQKANSADHQVNLCTTACAHYHSLLIITLSRLPLLPSMEELRRLLGDAFSNSKVFHSLLTLTQ